MVPFIILPLLAKAAEMVIPSLLTIVIEHYERKPNLDAQATVTLINHQQALEAIKPRLDPPNKTV
jgi:hypothetical protein